MENTTEQHSDQNLELEAKSMLTKEQYERMMFLLGLKKEDAKEQINSFFDNEGWQLNEQNITLRSRSKKGIEELTVKEDSGEGRLETNHRPFTLEEKHVLLAVGIVPDGNVKAALARLNVPGPYLFQGAQTTWRIEIPYKGCKLALDYTEYLGRHDYEIEMERDDGQADQQKVLADLLLGAGIPYQHGLGKRKRFFMVKKSQAETLVT